MAFNYPLRFKGLKTGVVVEFTSLTLGTIIETGRHPGSVGEVIKWIPHTYTYTWVPIALPSTKVRLHKQIGDYRGTCNNTE